MPEFDGVKNFERQQNGLLPIKAAVWEKFVFVNLNPQASSIEDFFGGLVKRVAPLQVTKLHYFDSRTYDIHCNWKVFVDNYLDGGYHVPHLHKVIVILPNGIQLRAHGRDEFQLSVPKHAQIDP